TPGAFPSLEVFELPTVHQNDAVATNQAIQAMYDEYLADELSDVHPVLIHTAAGLMPFTKGVEINGLNDFEGLRLRSPNRTGAWLIEALGATPVSLPVPEFPHAIG
ncbi:C4-dicarboxylate ABC transporter substrate-binding protein, partial [Gammaproteobacteria bacterium]|nr:C4-dicarboxylate ABC transporter substrate-binding protein [Gammaproteobacteria bacterium]